MMHGTFNVKYVTLFKAMHSNVLERQSDGAEYRLLLATFFKHSFFSSLLPEEKYIYSTVAWLLKCGK